MASCFSCGADFTTDANALLKAFKKQYLEKGVIRYYYKLHTTDDIKICRSNSFKEIYEKDIKPNFNNGAEYAHIAEYK